MYAATRSALLSDTSAGASVFSKSPLPLPWRTIAAVPAAATPMTTLVVRIHR